MKGQTESDVIKAIRILSARQVEAAGSGHPGTPLGAAPATASANGALHFGVREHAMAAICNGIALHGDYAEEQSSMPEPGKAGVIFLPYMMGERSPHNDVDARSMFVGMRPDTTRGAMGLAVLEGVALGMRSQLERAGGAAEITRTRICGGGAKSALWRRIVANVIGVPVETVATEKGPAYGAALLAMTGCGEYAGVKEACEACVRVSGVTEPEADLREVYDRLYVIYDSIYPAMRKIFADMRGV